jgi:hypothetical protein
MKIRHGASLKEYFAFRRTVMKWLEESKYLERAAPERGQGASGKFIES